MHVFLCVHPLTRTLLISRGGGDAQAETARREQLQRCPQPAPAYVNYSVTDYLLCLPEEGTAPDGVLVGEAFTKAKAPEQLKKHVKTTLRKKTQIGALRLGIPFCLRRQRQEGR